MKCLITHSAACPDSFGCMGTGQIFHSGRRYRERRQLKGKKTACESRKPDYKTGNHWCILPDLYDLTGNGQVIPGMYESTVMEDRYTYTGGSTVGGAVVYDGDMFLYSHHATDPCAGFSANAFDLVRLTSIGMRIGTQKSGTPVNKLPS